MANEFRERSRLVIAPEVRESTVVVVVVEVEVVTATIAQWREKGRVKDRPGLGAANRRWRQLLAGLDAADNAGGHATHNRQSLVSREHYALCSDSEAVQSG